MREQLAANSAMAIRTTERFLFMTLNSSKCGGVYSVRCRAAQFDCTAL
jgi:hypothetical protein